MQVGGGGGVKKCILDDVEVLKGSFLHCQGSHKRSKNLAPTVHLQRAFHGSMVA